MPKTSGSEDAEGGLENSGLTTVFTSLHTNNVQNESSVPQ